VGIERVIALGDVHVLVLPAQRGGEVALARVVDDGDDGGQLGWRRASLRAAATLQPLEMPQKMPSSRARRRAVVTLSSVVVVMIPVSWETSRLRGTKPSPMPSMPWWPHARFDRSAHSAGSTA
jgi:hypothetical protein